MRHWLDRRRLLSAPSVANVPSALMSGWTDDNWRARMAASVVGHHLRHRPHSGRSAAPRAALSSSISFAHRARRRDQCGPGNRWRARAPDRTCSHAWQENWCRRTLSARWTRGSPGRVPTAAEADPLPGPSRSSAQRLVHVGGTTANGAPLCNRNARRDWFDEAAAAIGAPGLTAHELRHTAASLAVSAGANVKAGPAHARARFGGGHPRPLCRPVGRRSETWWRTGWTLWRAWRANFLRTV